MIASLPMYDRAETADAYDRLWALIRDNLRKLGLAAPDALTRDANPWDIWRAPDLVLAQTCGLPYRARLHDRVSLVATPDYGLKGCPPGHYRSVLVVRVDDPRARVEEFDGAALAYNEALSESGWAAVRRHFDALGLRLRGELETGSHRACALAVAQGKADLASIDAVSWAMVTRWDPFASRLRVLGHTRPTPGLPLIAAPGTDCTRTRTALRRALAAFDPGDRALLRIRGFVEIPPEAYLALPLPPAP